MLLIRSAIFYELWDVSGFPKIRIRQVGILALLPLIACACKTTGSTGARQKAVPAAMEVEINPEATAPKKPDFLINGAVLKGEVLEIFISYTGGCEQHTFVLSSTGQIQKSLPPKTPLYLQNTGPADACREYITDTLYFNMQKVIRQNPKGITFVLNSETLIPTTP